jgi:Uma2 family endonuclease
MGSVPFVSEEEFLSLPESNQKIELVDGEVIVAPAPILWHQEILRRLVTSLGNWAHGFESSVTIGLSPLDVRFAPGRILQPDAMVFLTKLPWDQQGPINRVPEICVEVLSSDRLYDRVTKRFIYAAAGVKEYWVVDRNAFIERWSEAGLAHEEILRERLTSPLLPGFELDLARLFADLG